jgi:proteasome inhibitor subunit 1 (PI31)
MSDILDPSALLSRLPTLLSSEKTLKSPQDGFAALLHAAMTVLSFRLVGVDDETSANTFEDNVLPEGWNKNGPGHYTLRYKHDQSSLEFVMKLSKLGSRTMINAIALEVHSSCSFLRYHLKSLLEREGRIFGRFFQ